MSQDTVVNHIVLTRTFCQGQDETQSHFFNRSKAGLNLKSFISKTGCQTKDKKGQGREQMDSCLSQGH